MSKKYAKHVVSGLKTVRSLPYHKPDKFFYPILMSSKRAPESKFWTYYFILPMTEGLAKNPTVSWAERHRHPEGSEELYLVVGEPGAITAEITLGDSDEMEIYTVTSPGAVFIPAGVTHSIKPVKMTPGKIGGIIAVVHNATGEYICLPPK